MHYVCHGCYIDKRSSLVMEVELMDVIELAARQDWCHIDAAISGKISVIHTSAVYCDSVKTRFRRSIPRYIYYVYLQCWVLWVHFYEWVLCYEISKLMYTIIAMMLSMTVSRNRFILTPLGVNQQEILYIIVCDVVWCVLVSSQRNV